MQLARDCRFSRLIRALQKRHRFFGIMTLNITTASRGGSDQPLRGGDAVQRGKRIIVPQGLPQGVKDTNF